MNGLSVCTMPGYLTVRYSSGSQGGGGGVMHSGVSWPYGWNKLDMTVQMDSMDVDDMSMKCQSNNKYMCCSPQYW